MMWPYQCSRASYLADYGRHAHAPSDIFIPDTVQSREAERPTKHLHLHTVEGLLMLGGGWPTL